jgi:hypothetical protein
LHQSAQFDGAGGIKKTHIEMRQLPFFFFASMGHYDTVMVVAYAFLPDTFDELFGGETVSKDQDVLHFSLFGYNFAIR